MAGTIAPTPEQIDPVSETVAHSSAAVARRRRRLASRRTVWCLRLLALIVVAAGWIIAAHASRYIPTASASASSLVDRFQDGTIFDPLGDTTSAIGIAFVISALGGVIIGLVLGCSRLLGAIFDPIVMAMFAVPRFVLYPVALAIWGVGPTSKIAMGVLSGLFPIALNTIAGLRAVNPSLDKLGRSLGCSRLRMIRSIYLPAALPSIMVGVRLGFSLCFMGVVLAELFAASKGLGLDLRNAYVAQRYEEMFGLALLVTAMAFVGNLVLGFLERRARDAVT
jgi:NitT/TauT family transport system permease protein